MRGSNPPFLILPVAYEVGSILIKAACADGRVTLPVWSFPLLTVKPPVTFFVFVLMVFFLKFRELRYCRHGNTHEDYEEFLHTNRNSLHFSIFLAVMLVIAGIVDAVIMLYMMIKQAGSVEALEKLMEAADDYYPIAVAVGFGKSIPLMFIAPLMLLYSYTRKPKLEKVSTLIPVAGIALIAIVVIQGGYQVLSVANLTALVAVAGIFLRKFRKGVKENNVGNLLLGFVILMTGMTAMSAAVEPLQHNESFLNLMTNFSNPLLGFAVGLVFTAVIQSSAAAVGIVQALSMTGVMTFSSAFPIMMGIAVGGAVPVLLSVLGSGANEVRAALMHLIMDICGAALCMALFYIVNGIHHLAFADSLMNPVSIALVNTIFRLFTVIVLMPLVPALVRITRIIVRSPEVKEEPLPALALLEDRFLKYPTLALTQVQNVALSMSEVAAEGIRDVGQMLQGYSEELFEKMAKMEDDCDAYEDALGNYLMQIIRHELNDEEDEEASLMLHAISDFERISDYSMNMAHTLRELDEKGMNFSDRAHRELAVAQSAVNQAVDMTRTIFETKEPIVTRKIVVLSGVVDDLCEELRQHHNRRLQDGTCTLEQGISFNEILGNYESTVDRCRKLAYMILELAEGIYMRSGGISASEPGRRADEFR